MSTPFRWIRAAAALLLFASGGCASRPFNVKVVPHVESESLGAAAASGQLSVRAAARWDDEWSLENLDANAVLAGVLPVHVELENAGGAPFDVRSLRFRASDPAGSSIDVVDAKKARGAIVKYYGVKIRSKAGNERFKQDFDANAIDVKTPLAAGERRQGLVFLAVPRGATRQTIRLTVDPGHGGRRVETVLD